MFQMIRRLFFLVSFSAIFAIGASAFSLGELVQTLYARSLAVSQEWVETQKQAYHEMTRQQWDALRHGLADYGFAIEEIYVDGRVRQSAESLREALQMPAGKPLLGLDLQSAQKRLLALEWVKSVRINRRWPDIIYVRLTEHIPFLLWETNGDTYVLDRAGVTIPVRDVEALDTLPRFAGASAKDAVALVRELNAYPALRQSLVGGIRLSPSRWVLHLAQGGRLHLPADSKTRARHLLRFLSVAGASDLLQSQEQEIDLRFADRILLRPLKANYDGKGI